ncbi:glycosyltransferase [Kitasatospora gansuensis]
MDADVRPEPGAFAALIDPIVRDTADVAAYRIVLARSGSTLTARLLAHWSELSMEAWHRMRGRHPEHRWALPGALYALRRDLLPKALEIPLVDDASIGLQAKLAGARIGYAADALVRVTVPETFREWRQQKLRSRRGWGALRDRHPQQVLAFDRSFATCLREVSAGDPTVLLMRLQDSVLRLAARLAPDRAACTTGAWTPQRSGLPGPDAAPVTRLAAPTGTDTHRKVTTS